MHRKAKKRMLLRSPRVVSGEHRSVAGEGGRPINSTAVRCALRHAHDNIIQLLLVNGPRVGAPEGKFGSALLVAASDGHESTIRLLLEKGPT
jgi:hypothetical protein